MQNIRMRLNVDYKLTKLISILFMSSFYSTIQMFLLHIIF